MRVDQTLDCLIASDQPADQDRQDNRDARVLLSPLGLQSEGDANWHCCEGIPNVVNEVSKQGDASRPNEDTYLQSGGCQQNRKRHCDSAHAVAGPEEIRVKWSVMVAWSVHAREPIGVADKERGRALRHALQELQKLLVQPELLTYASLPSGPWLARLEQGPSQTQDLDPSALRQGRRQDRRHDHHVGHRQGLRAVGVGT